MDIERLKELKGITEQLYQDGNVPLTYCDDVLGTIDEAIAAQSDKHPMAGTDPDADDWGNGYSRGYADGLQICQSATSEEVAISKTETSQWRTVTNTTNYDRIMRDMTVEQMAKLLIEPLEEADSGMVFYHTSTGGSYDYDDAIRAEIEWLKKECDA